VLGPFNLPAHLPHSHIIPALLAGNAVVFKPSEFAPGVAAFCADLWRDAGLPPGVLNLVQGGRETGEALARHAGIDGLLFTGSYRAGLALSRIFAETPGKILALELGGNNPLVVWEPQDLAKAAELIVQSAYLTSGQRCVCARRMILPEGGEGDELIEALSERIRGVISGAWNDAPEPFMGPLIHNAAADALLSAQDKLVSSGARILIPAQRSARGPALVTPGLLDATQASNRPDEEFFGPLLQVLRVPDFEAAMVEANNTRFGLAAGLISSRRDLWERFLGEARAGVVNWNRPLTGASGKFPFGGVGQSGNHRPSAWSAADYCQYPVASLEADTGPEA
jgi:succinylglutamic semialdehyde dehydrogenase